MQPGHRCAGEPSRPTGHTEACSFYPLPTDPLPCHNAAYDASCLPDDFYGPYKDFNPPGDRNPAAGEAIWGDVPYLPSYQDPALSQSHPSGPPDNLFTRGPFYKGVSETHDEFRNPGGFQPKKFNEFVRHYEEPGLKFDKSITQTDFGPPYPRMPRDRSPSLTQSADSKISKPVQNLHAKEYERRSSEPEVYFVDVEPKWNLTTEASDNYVCFQRPKVKNQLRDLKPVRDEVFLERVRETHEYCPYGLPHEFFCDVNKCGRNKVLTKKEICTDTEREPWLLYPKNYSFPNGYLILPSDCRNQQEG